MLWSAVRSTSSAAPPSQSILPGSQPGAGLTHTSPMAGMTSASNCDQLARADGDAVGVGRAAVDREGAGRHQGQRQRRGQQIQRAACAQRADRSRRAARRWASAVAVGVGVSAACPRDRRRRRAGRQGRGRGRGAGRHGSGVGVSPSSVGVAVSGQPFSALFTPRISSLMATIAVVVDVERWTGADRLRIQRDVDADDQLVDGDHAVAVAVAHTALRLRRRTGQQRAERAPHYGERPRSPPQVALQSLLPPFLFAQMMRRSDECRAQPFPNKGKFV